MAIRSTSRQTRTAAPYGKNHWQVEKPFSSPEVKVRCSNRRIAPYLSRKGRRRGSSSADFRGAETVVPGLARVDSSRHLALTRDGIYLLLNNRPPWLIWFYDWKSHSLSSVTTIERAGVRNPQPIGLA